MSHIEKFRDISMLYNIESIRDDCIYVKNKNELVKEYIYEIVPINMLNSSVNELYKILNLYIEFLKSFDMKFKILIRNYKFNKDEYINKHINMCSLKNQNIELYNNYIQDLKTKIENKEIYNSKMYMCVICSNINDIDTCFTKLKNIGLEVNKLNNSQIRSLLYETINKK